MGFARTVLGDMDTSIMGRVYAHEHLIISGGVAAEKNKALLLKDMDKTCEELENVKPYGIRTFVDMMPVSVGRDCSLLVDIAKKAGVNVIACTGFHKPMYYHDLHWIYKYTEDQIAALLSEEIEIGMDANEYLGPVVRRVSAKAGLIKAASDYNCIKKISVKLFAAAAQAHLKTGAPLATHTEHGTYAFEQIKLLSECGIKPENVIISHLDRNPDIEYHTDVAQTGVFLEYDNISRIKYWPDKSTADLIFKMVERGFEDKILLGTDMALNTYWKAYDGGPGMAYLMNTFVPRLKKQGLSETVIDKFLVANPAKAFAFRKV